jgi:hypothetical protein
MLSRRTVLLTPPISLRLRRNSHGIITFADPHSLNSFVSYRYENIGGGLAPRRSDVPPYFDISPFLSSHCALFCAVARLKPFLFKCFRTLCPKTTRGGVSMEGRLFRDYPSFPFPCPLSVLLYIVTSLLLSFSHEGRV